MAAAVPKNLCVYVDDDPGLGAMGTLMLKGALGDTWDVVYISDPQRGQEITLSGMYPSPMDYTSSRVDMMVLDHHMPGITGVEIAQSRREKEKKDQLERMPLYLHSSDNESLKPHYHLFTGVIPKPVALGRLQELLRQKNSLL